MLDLASDTPEFLFGTRREEEVHGCHMDIFISYIDRGRQDVEKTRIASRSRIT